MFSGVNWPDVIVAVALSLAVALVASALVARAVRMAFPKTSASDDASRKPIWQRLVRAARVLVAVVTLALVLPPSFEYFGIDLAYGVPLERMGEWLFGQGLRVLLVTGLAYVAVGAASIGVGRFESLLVERAGSAVDESELQDRLHTIAGLIRNALKVLIVGAASLMILRELGLNITPLLTAAGIGGLAVGFGAQNLVRDVISGFFLILEDQVHLGDVVTVDGTSGQVEGVRLRTLVLRDLSGTVHVIPNGSISKLSNMTKDYSYTVLDVGVAYKEDTDDVSDVLREVGAELQAEPDFKNGILEPLEILGVNEFGDSAVVIRVRMKTVPLKQWRVGRELRRRIKKAFDARNIEIPFPHTSVYFGEASKPFAVATGTAPAADRGPEAPSPSGPRSSIQSADTGVSPDAGTGDAG